MKRFLLPIVLAALVFQVGCAGPQSYVGYQGNNHRSGGFAGSGPEQQPSELWRFLALDSIYHVRMIDDNLYAFGSDDSVYAVDIDSGRRQWRFRDGNALFGLPAVDGDALYVRKRDGENEVFAALDARDGGLSWSRDLDPSPGRGQAAVGGDRIYFSNGFRKMIAMELSSGEPLWQFETEGECEAGPTLVEDTLYVTDDDGYLYALNADSGEERWRIQVVNPRPGEHISGYVPAYRDGLVVARWSDTVAAVDVATQEVLWRHEVPSYNNPTLARGKVYMPGTGELVALDERTGEVLWSRDGQVFSEAAVAGDRLYISCRTEVCAMDADTGEMLWRYPSSRGRVEDVIVHEGRLYITTHHGYLIALE